MELQRWVGALHDHVLRAMEFAETRKGRITEDDVRIAGMSRDAMSEGCTSFSSRARKEKQRTMSATQRGEVSKPGNRWSVTGADRSVAYSRVTHLVSPSGMTPTRPKALQAARTTMQSWTQEVAEFEIKYAKKNAKILALKSIMPETLFGEAGAFRGRSFSTHAELRTVIIRYLDDKVPVSMMTKSSSLNVTTSCVQNKENERTRQRGGGQRQHHARRTLCMVQQFMKGKGKGKSKDKGVWILLELW